MFGYEDTSYYSQYLSQLNGSLSWWEKAKGGDIYWRFKLGDIIKLDMYDPDFWLITDRCLRITDETKCYRIVPYFDFNEIHVAQMVPSNYSEHKWIKCKPEDLTILLTDKDPGKRQMGKRILYDMEEED